MYSAQLYDGGNPGLDGLVHTGTGANDTVLYWGIPTGVFVLAQRNVTMMPGGAVLTFSQTSISHQLTSLNSSGEAMFKSGLTGGDVSGTTNDIAWIKGIPFSLSYFIREADLVLGGTVGIGTLGVVGVLNEAGDALHDATLSTTLGSAPATVDDDKVLFVTPASSGVHSLLMREGNVAPDGTGAPMPGVLYGQPTVAQGFGSNATAAFHCTMTGAVTPADDGALFAGGIGSVKLAAREGEVVPGNAGDEIATLNSATNCAETNNQLFGFTRQRHGDLAI
jgi:hypothetical protein